MDELELLRRHRPLPDSAPVNVKEEARMELMQVIETETMAPRVIKRRRWLVWAGAVAIVAGGTAAAWALLREPTHAASFGCLADNVTAVLPNDGTSPVESCKRAWEAGAMIEGVTKAPPLVACVSPHGPVLVIERTTERSCEDQGMAPWAEERDYLAVGRAVRTVRISFHDRYKQTGERCASSGEWRSRLTDELRREGLNDWQIRFDQIRPDRHCYDVGYIYPQERTIVVIGHPGDDSIGCDPRTGC